MAKSARGLRARGTRGKWKLRLPAAPEALDTAVLVFPLFLVYQVGIATGGLGRNGADFVTTWLFELCRSDRGTYLLLFVALVAGYVGLLAFLRQSGQLHPRRFGALLLESTGYALCLGSVILLVINNVLYFVPGLTAREALGDPNVLEVLVISAGAGLHEELIFRVGLMGGLAWFLTGRLGSRSAWLWALAFSSVAFAAVHHVGGGSEPFTWMAFVYRSLAGVYFGVVYQLRGFAVAAWTHALYDVYVLTFAD